MKLIIGEGWETLLDRFSYRGCIGMFYNTTWEGVLTYLIATVVIILAIIGLLTVLKTIFGIGGHSSTKSKSGLSKQEQQWLFGKK